METIKGQFEDQYTQNYFFFTKHISLMGGKQSLQIARKMAVHFFKSLHPYKDKMSIEKIFHLPDSELPAKW